MGKRNKGGGGEGPRPPKQPPAVFTEEELNMPKPPLWAKGKNIGMWHRQKKLLKLRNEGGTLGSKKKEEACYVQLGICQNKFDKIKQILQRVTVDVPPQVSTARGGISAHDKYKHVEESAFKKKFLRSITGSIQDKISQGQSGCSMRRDQSIDFRLRSLEENKETDSRVREMMKFRKNLPAWKQRKEILDTLEKNNVVLISGETGCGKTTQVGQFILEQNLLEGRGSVTNVICTQPRRISAISVAERVADERGERLGQSVGYQIRLEKVLPRDRGSLLYCTTGVLLQFMHSNPLLSGVSHVIIDEIHERDTIADFILAILKDVIPSRKDLKVILMSATLNAETFSKYFNDCPMIHIPGFTYPVVEYYLEDILENIPYKFPKNPQLPRAKGREAKLERAAKIEIENNAMEAYIKKLEASKNYSKAALERLRNADSEIHVDLIMDVIYYICNKLGPGAILVFLPGWDKIAALNKMMNDSGNFPSSRYLIIPLHSMMPTIGQREVFNRPPHGVRKIIIATNIAETSITIDDVVYVVDCGKVKINSFDAETNLTRLAEEWVSLANAKQRRGRAGRVQPGVCFHVYPKWREDFFDPYMIPEILRTRLEEVILQGKIIQLGKMGPFLTKVMDPPSSKAVELSIQLLKDMNALDDDEQLTPLGYHLGNLPVAPQAGKMLLFGALFSVLDPITSIAASLTYKDPFLVPLGKENEVMEVRRNFDANELSDHLTIAKVLCNYEDAKDTRSERNFVYKNFLSRSTLDQLLELKDQLASLLHDMKYLSNKNVVSKCHNANSYNISLIRSVICAGLFPNIAIIKDLKKKNTFTVQKIETLDGQNVHFSRRSVFENADSFNSRFVVFHEKILNKQIVLHDVTMIFPMALIFFCDKFRVFEFSVGDKTTIEVHPRIRFICNADLANLILELRAWLDWLLEFKVSHPCVTDWSQETDETLILKAIIELIASEEQLYSVPSASKDEVVELSDSDDSE